MHIPVLRSEVLEYLAVRPDGFYLDATAGLGGHTLAIAERLTTSFVIANDRDADSLELAGKNTAPYAEKIRFHRGSFRELKNALSANGIATVNGLLADLGVSRYQMTEGERGFSILTDGPLDMRMDRTTGITAEQLVNYSAEKELADLIYQSGEERRARRIARAIVRARPIKSTLHLASVVERAVPRTGRIHPATQTFMALRRAVNDEDGELEALLGLGPELVTNKGRIVIISFMSLEDRRVKQAFRELARNGRGTLLTKHVVRPTAEEIRDNPASRSAVLRALELQ